MGSSSGPVELLGLETEYLLVRRPDRGRAAAPAGRAFEAMRHATCEMVPWLPSRYRMQEGRFLANGARMYFEQSHEGLLAGEGLLELASAECADPPALLTHERGLEHLLAAARPEAANRLASRGWSTDLEVARPSRDAFDHGLGSQENFAVRDPLGLVGRLLLLGVYIPAWLLVYVLPVVLMIVATVVGLVGALTVVLITGAIATLWAALEALLPLRMPGPPGPSQAHLDRVGSRLLRLTVGADAAVVRVACPILGALARHLFLRRYLRHLPTILAVREVLCGDGALTPDGFRLSGRALTMTRPAGMFAFGAERPMVDLKHALFPSYWRGRTRRMQVLLSPACMLPEARLLRTGILTLVLEVLGEGDRRLVRRLPRLADPPRALAHLNRDPWLRRPLALADGGTATALEILSAVHALVQEHLDARGGASGWRAHVMARWAATMDDLAAATRLAGAPEGEAALASLRGRVDWITKRWLLRRLGDGRVPSPADPGWEAARKIDLRWHVVAPPDAGYAYRLAEAGGMPLASAAMLREALHPPEGTRAVRRGDLIREAARTGISGWASWDRVKLRGSPRVRL
ncbi:MAG: proteasome accessory factor PafA2 family protein [Myxococcota bacterium]